MPSNDVLVGKVIQFDDEPNCWVVVDLFIYHPSVTGVFGEQYLLEHSENLEQSRRCSVSALKKALAKGSAVILD